MDVVGGDDAEMAMRPFDGLGNVGRTQHGVADALGLRGPRRHAQQVTGARVFRVAKIQCVDLHRQRRHGRDAVHDLDADTVMLVQAYPLAAARLGDVFYGRSSRSFARERMQVFLRPRPERDADDFRLALFGNVDVVARICTAHI